MEDFIHKTIVFQTEKKKNIFYFLLALVEDFRVLTIRIETSFFVFKERIVEKDAEELDKKS